VKSKPFWLLCLLFAAGPSARAENSPGAPAPEASASERPFDVIDLAAYFTSGKRLQAKEAFEQGRYHAVRQLLAEEGDDPPVRYLRGLAALRNGESAVASNELSLLAPSYPAMTDACLYYAGLAEERAGHFDLALERYRAVEQRSRLYATAVMAASRTLGLKKDWAGAANELAPLWNGSPSDEIRSEALWALANAYDKAHRRADARATLLKLWAMGPRFGLAAAAGSRLAGNIPPEAHVEHAEAVLNANFGASARAELRPILKRFEPPNPVGCYAHFLVGKAWRKERRHAMAVAELKPVVATCKDPQLKGRALYVLGYSQSVIDPKGAIDTYEQLARELPQDPLAPDALFLAAEARGRIGDVDGAYNGYLAVTQQYPDSDFSEALFRAFWIDWRRGSFEEGLAQLEMLELSHRADVLHRARYWHARALEALGRRDEAIALVQTLAADGTAGYYGEMARARLAELDPVRAQKLVTRSPFSTGGDALWPLDPGPLAADPHFRAGVELIRLGMPGGAAELLAIDRAKLPPTSSRLLFQVLYMGGYVAASGIVAQATLNDDAEGTLAGDARLLWELNFPKAFRDTIERYGKASRVDPDLLQALIREESHFATRARSSTGALGLAQLMPATARLVAGSLRLHGFTTASLLQPERNIQLGSAYLSQLLHQFSGNKILAVAAYNAGPGAVSRWLAGRPDQPMDEWVEEIPVQETRDYVKHVMGSCRTYGQLYNRLTIVADAME
jgi:soluble lytic murein transglycosylase